MGQARAGGAEECGRAPGHPHRHPHAAALLPPGGQERMQRGLSQEPRQVSDCGIKYLKRKYLRVRTSTIINRIP